MTIPPALKRPRILVALAIGILIVGYLLTKAFSTASAQTRYVLSSVTKGTLVTSVEGTGQVSASNQVDVKAEASGKTLKVNVKNGDAVDLDDILVQLDDRDGRNAVRDAGNALQSAQVALEKLKKPNDEYEIAQGRNDVDKANAALDKLSHPDRSTLLQAQDALEKAKSDLEKLKLTQTGTQQDSENTVAKSQESITKAYEDASSAVSAALVTFPTVTSALDTILHGSTIDGSTENVSALANSVEDADKPKIAQFRTTTETDYRNALTASTSLRDTFNASGRSTDPTVIEALLNQAIDATRSVSTATQSARNYIGGWVDMRTARKLSIFPKVTEYQGDLDGYVTDVNKDLSDLLSTRQALTDNRNALESAKRDLSDLAANGPRDISAAQSSVAEKQAALDKLTVPDPLDVRSAQLDIQAKQTALDKLIAGADPLDVRQQELTVQQRANALSDAREKLSDASVKAPFGGIVAAVSVKQGETVTSGTAVATLVTTEHIAEITLNEVDVAKVKVGQKATLTFDAVESLSISGQVGEVDTLGTVTQGVVTYGVKILFDTDDDRIRPGMSVSASVITAARQDVLSVPSSAVKSSGAGSYVEMPDETVSASSSTAGITLSKPAKQVPVETGMSNDTSTEIISGLKEGDRIITRTITASTTTSAQTQGQNLFQLGGGNRAATGGAAGGNATFRAGGAAAPTIITR